MLAEHQWRRDRRRTLTTIFVYEWLWDELDFSVPMDCKREWVAAKMDMRGRGQVSHALALLIRWGYLKDWRTSKQEPRRLTKVHKLAPEHVLSTDQLKGTRKRAVRKADHVERRAA